MSQPPPLNNSTWEHLLKQAARIREETARVIVGQNAVVEQMLTALLCRGHCLLVGVPYHDARLDGPCLGRLADLFQPVRYGRQHEFDRPGALLQQPDGLPEYSGETANLATAAAGQRQYDGRIGRTTMRLGLIRAQAIIHGFAGFAAWEGRTGGWVTATRLAR